MNHFAKRLTASAILAACAGSVQAADFYICPPVTSDRDPACTSVITKLTVNVTPTSHYGSTGSLQIGDTVIDNGTGYVTGLNAGADATTQDQLYNDQDPDAYYTAQGEDGTSRAWHLSLDFDKLQQTVANFTIQNDADDSGTATAGDTVTVFGGVTSADAAASDPINLYYEDGLRSGTSDYETATLLAQLLPVSGTADGNSLFLTLEVDFTNANATLADDFFWFEGDQFDTERDWYSLWQANQSSANPNPLLISAVFDYNITSIALQDDPGTLFSGDPDEFNYIFTRTSSADGSIIFQEAPEPGTLALIGAGLLGAGLTARRRFKKA